MWPDGSWQVAEKRPSAALLSSFVAATYLYVLLTPQDLSVKGHGHPTRSGSPFSGALHLDVFEQPANMNFFSMVLKQLQKDFLCGKE
ncbi:MAG: hypothetical protein CVU57_16375 [Deltaproteobacteria bacterium HGW-Deltaproteobacteria-15]|jgi:hypothetical protein|nr:MAG: hypothetical protein CVU57_16375 [Deltaproteobacteria bacterium HGW-Deltaproteobacteria-15]